MPTSLAVRFTHEILRLRLRMTWAKDVFEPAEPSFDNIASVSDKELNAGVSQRPLSGGIDHGTHFLPRRKSYRRYP
jgi:hypothetical protein